MPNFIRYLSSHQVKVFLQSIVLEQQIQEQDTTIAQLRQQLKAARAKLEHTTNSLTEQIETLEVRL